MSEDVYFKDKAKNTISRLLTTDMDIDKEQLYKMLRYSEKDELLKYFSDVFKASFEDILYIALKEVARDQRYSCIDAFIKSTYDPDASESRHISAIQNAQITGE